MAMSGTLNECMGKLYELYLEDRITDENTIRYLKMLRHPNGRRVYSDEDIHKLLELLKHAL